MLLLLVKTAVQTAKSSTVSCYIIINYYYEVRIHRTQTDRETGEQREREIE